MGRPMLDFPEKYLMRSCILDFEEIIKLIYVPDIKEILAIMETTDVNNLEHAGVKRDAEDDDGEPAAKRMRTEYLEAYMVKVTSFWQSRQKKEIKTNEMNKTNNINIEAYSPISLEESSEVR